VFVPLKQKNSVRVAAASLFLAAKQVLTRISAKKKSVSQALSIHKVTSFLVRLIESSVLYRFLGRNFCVLFEIDV